MKVVVLGAGGQARDTAWLIQEIAAAGADIEFVGFVVSDLQRLGERDSRAQVLGDLSWLEAHGGAFQALALGVGSPAVRLRLAEEARRLAPRAEWPALVHPRVEIDRKTLRLGQGAMIGAGVVGSVSVELGDFALVNLGCTLGHEATLGSGVVVNHGASISGGVLLEEGVLVGTGARVLQYLTVGRGATVGAGAVVTKNVAPGQTVVGVPARPLVVKAG
ncbi:MAG: hypothetical protein SFV15_17425 [Polyangiaceae bacterium]|nr:hypothetical protein [Polyangiaceae bacterium]